MKLRFLSFFLVVAALSIAADSPREEKKIEPPRLTDISAFPEKDRPAIRAIIAAVSASGGKPSEYFADLSPTKEGQMEVYLKHESHPADDSGWRGDACGRCRITRYDPKSGKIGPLQGIR